ncbi:MAG: bifunctional riboflavin kinase/FAD synthetase [Fimbriimonadales bacterium]|nr:MAG: riboflavin biosynthesis protein [Fimbriimonadales bacterium]
MSWVIGAESLQGAFPDGCAATLGVFDGVHRGHAALVEATVRWARARGVPTVALTFEPHPAAVLAPDQRPPMLCPLAHRVQKLRRLGIDCVIVQPFTREFSLLSAEAFIERILRDSLNARAVVVGDDFRFGQGRRGTVATLQGVGAFEVLAVPRVRDPSGAPISSTRAREVVRAGDMEQARALLGEPFCWTGVVVRGDGRGRTLGYPTANLAALEPLLTPAEGVYACLAQLSGEMYPAAVSVGAPPMFENARGRIEAYLIGLPDRDLYGHTLTLQFLQRLRPQQKFESLDALLVQMAHDVEQTRQLTQEVELPR